VGLPDDESLEASAGVDSAELAVIAHDDQLGAGRLCFGEQAQHGGVVTHARLVADHHGAAVQTGLPVVDPPQQGGDGPRLHAGLSAQGASSLAGDGGAHHPIAGVLERLAGGVEGGRLPRAGRAHDQLHGSPGCDHSLDHGFLTGGERQVAQLLFFGGDGFLGRLHSNRGRAGSVGLKGHLQGDGGLHGEHTGGGVGLLAGGPDAYQCHRVGVATDRFDRSQQLSGSEAEQQRPHGDGHVGSSEHLLLGQPP
jgi:hypothetical protein